MKDDTPHRSNEVKQEGPSEFYLLIFAVFFSSEFMNQNFIFYNFCPGVTLIYVLLAMLV